MFVTLGMTLLILVVLLGAGALYVIVMTIPNHWGRYELRWDREDPMPDPRRFLTRFGAEIYRKKVSEISGDGFYVHYTGDEEDD